MRKKKQVTAQHMYNRAELVWMDCKVCSINGAYVTSNIKAYTCSTCVSQQVAPPEEKVKPEEKRPRGWHFMDEYVSPSGKIYHKGVETNESISGNKRNVGRGKGKEADDRTSNPISQSIDIKNIVAGSPKRRGRPPKNRGK